MAEGGGDVRLVGAVSRLEDGQGAQETGAGVGQLARLSLDDAQVAEGQGDFGVVGAGGRLIETMPRSSQIPAPLQMCRTPQLARRRSPRVARGPDDLGHHNAGDLVRGLVAAFPKLDTKRSGHNVG